MTDRQHQDTIPKAALYSMAALVFIALVFATVARLSGWGASVVAHADPILTRQLLVEDRADGAVIIKDASTKRVISIAAPGKHGFLRGIFRSLTRERQMRQIDQSDAVFNLALREDGRLTLSDLDTDTHIELIAFGPTNVAVFRALLETRSASQ